MQLTGPTFLLVAFSLATGVRSLCTTPGYLTGICAATVRPYSENAYVWGGACGIAVPPTGPQTLMAYNVEFYDPQYGWYACLLRHPREPQLTRRSSQRRWRRISPSLLCTGRL